MIQYRTFVMIVLIVAVTGCATTKTNWVSDPVTETVSTPGFEATLEPIKYDNPFFVAFRLTVKNSGTDPISIDWNRSTYLFDGSRRGIFIFKGIAPEEIRDKTIPPDTVQPGQILVKEIAPFRLLAGAPLKARHKTDSRISAGMIDEGENGILLVIQSGGTDITKRITTTIRNDHVKP